MRAPPGAAQRSTDEFGVLRICVQSASGLKAADKGGTSDPYAKLFLGEHVISHSGHKTSHINKTLDPVWNENFEFHGVLKDLLKHKLEVNVRDHDIGGKNVGHSAAAAAENDLGSATFDLSDVQTADYEGESALSVQVKQPCSRPYPYTLYPNPDPNPNPDPDPDPSPNSNPNRRCSTRARRRACRTSPPTGATSTYRSRVC